MSVMKCKHMGKKIENIFLNNFPLTTVVNVYFNLTSFLIFCIIFHMGNTQT